MKTFNYVSFVGLFLSAGITHAALFPENVKVVDSSQVKIIKVDVESVEGKDGQLLTGLVQRTFFNSGIPDGHIDYVISSPQGNAVNSGLVQYNPPHGMRMWNYGASHRWRYGASFSIELPATVSDDAIMTLTYHQGDHARKLESTSDTPVETGLK